MPTDDRKLTMDELGRVAPGSYVPAQVRRVRVVLDDVRSRHNVGSVFRTADAFGVEGLVLCGFTPVPPHREIEKTALGATASVPWIHAAVALTAVESLRAQGYLILVVEQTLLARPLHDLDLPNERPIALVFGNELHGVSDAVVSASDGSIVIPQQGSKHSLNVSVCAGVVLYRMLGDPGSILKCVSSCTEAR